ncbi:MAG: dTMP kinase [archaeon]|nr:MAG: dTMP kinase [archaeon]
MKHLFIVLDGIDGNGKTTQALLLQKYLEKKGIKVFHTSEPTEGQHGKMIDDLLRQKLAGRIKKEKWIELFTQDSKEHQRKIQDNLNSEITVICDRYIYSTLTYQLEEKDWQSYISGFIKPDIIFILDVPIKIAIERIKQKYNKTREKKSYFEKQGVLTKVRKQFLKLPTFLDHNIKIIDSNRSEKEIFKDIKKEIDLLMNSSES